MKVTLPNFGEILIKDNINYSSLGLLQILIRCYFKSKQKLLEYINNNVQKLELCGFCDKHFSNYSFDIEIKNNIITFKNFRLKRDFMCLERECIEKRKHLNPNSFEHISKRKKISMEEADKWQKENNMSCFYLHPWETKEELSKRQKRDLEYYQNKYGEKEGLKRYNRARAGTSRNNSKENYIKNHSLEEWNELCDKKKQNLENFIKRYGEEEGKERYRQFRFKTTRIGYYYDIKSSKISSKEAFELFSKLKEKLINENILKEDEMIFADGVKTEKRITYYDECKFRWFDLDCYFPTIKLDLEYHGTKWHCDPEKDEIKRNPHGVIKTSEKERKRINILKNEYNIETIIVWSYEFKNSLEKENKINEIFNLIKEKYNAINK